MGQLYVWYLNQLDDYNAVIDDMRELDAQKLSENLSITGASVSASNALSITVSNNGGATAHIVSLWVIDESASPNTHTQSDVDVYVPRGGTGTVTGTATYGNILTLRLVTELGNTVSYRIAPASQVTNLRMTLDANPPTVIGSHDVGITLLIFNTNTDYDSLYNLQITPSSDITYTYTGSGESVTLTNPTTTTISSIRSGETAAFTWKYSIDLATPGETFTFKGRYTGASSFAEENVEVVTPFGRGEEEALENVLGSIRMIYDSIEWASRSPGTQTSGFTWSSNWQVDKDDYLVIRVNVTNDSSQDITLDQNTAIFMQRLETSGFKPFYIVKESGGTISTYDGSVVLLANNGNTVTLYFAVKDPGDDPSSSKQKLGNTGTFIAFLGITGTKNTTQYGQIIPFQAFFSTS